MRQEPLWNGGVWERGAQEVPPLIIPERQEEGHPCDRLGWRVFGVFLLLILMLSAARIVLFRVDISDLLPGWGYEDEEERKIPEPSLSQTAIASAGVGGTARMELQPKTGKVLTVQEIYELAGPSVVYIQARDESGMVSTGSGVVMTADGYILTNAHVIAGASEAQVILQNNTILAAGLVGYQEDYDLAVLKVEGGNLSPAQFGNSADLRVGDSVVAIGNPLGNTLRGTMTQGIVSGIDRDVNMDGTTMALIQTTAALNPGNSGGALINDRGQVVGVTSMKMMSRYETIEGLGFAVPTRLAKWIADQLIATGEAKIPALGITVRFDRDRYSGLEVLEVMDNSDAWAKGLRDGDIITAVNGIPMTDDSVLVTAKEGLNVGDSLVLTVDRNGKTLDLTIVLMDSKLFEE